ncbi:cyanophycinase [Bowmanella dokdonensis]|uniref:Type 1 glutamine amidotransferase-like domain-containing protein n=1 Tax=Bowmanella dokdonensis TaxID=751969 RepID=A0A939ISW3_9ALTE|nr:Type 1 glutamine amidotransferase-like domain-containing protein [Bowmanella dokdonensis]MBN7827594.1 Type 1 glutamine amidotransferase-like domain-containing protein [Bowmanella dokdonensis]
MKLKNSFVLTAMTTLLVCPAVMAKGKPGGGNGGGSSPSYEYALACGSAGNGAGVSQASLLIGGAEAGATGEVPATQWLINHATGGDYLVIRTGGTGGQAAWMCDTFGTDLGSAAEISIDSQSAANDPAVEAIVRDAEIIFIAGGDQNQYEDYWKGTLVEEALNDHLNVKQAPIAGTSAGLAVLGQSYYAPANLGVLSKEILDDPYHVNTQDINHGDFLSHPQLSAVITDTHLDRVTGKGRRAETRHGRILGFLARSVADTNNLNARAIGVEEGTLVALDGSGNARVYGEGVAYFLSANAYPEQISAGQPLVWDNGGQAVSVYKIQGSVSGNGSFDIAGWSGSGGTSQYWYTTAGYDNFNCKSGC